MTEVTKEDFDRLYETVQTLIKRVDTIQTSVTSTQRLLADIEKVNDSYDGFCLLQQQQAPMLNKNSIEEAQEDEMRCYEQYLCCWFCCT